MRSRLFFCRLSLALIAFLTASAASPVVAGEFFLGARPVKLEELKRNDVYAFLADDWAKFDKHVKDARNWMSGKVWSINWYLEVTPPFPTNWPPEQSRSITYYAYAEYQELFRHGPALMRSAPWAKVLLNEGMPAKKEILAMLMRVES